MKSDTIIVILLVAVTVGGGGFLVGMKYQQSKLQSRVGNFQGMAGAMRNGNFQQRTAAGFRPVRGEIISQDDESITVKLSDGSSKIILFSSSTSINKTSAGSKSDLKVGEMVMIFGKENSGGSVTAENIQLGQAFGNVQGSQGR